MNISGYYHQNSGWLNPPKIEEPPQDEPAPLTTPDAIEKDLLNRRYQKAEERKVGDDDELFEALLKLIESNKEYSEAYELMGKSTHLQSSTFIDFWADTLQSVAEDLKQTMKTLPPEWKEAANEIEKTAVLFIYLNHHFLYGSSNLGDDFVRNYPPKKYQLLVSLRVIKQRYVLFASEIESLQKKCDAHLALSNKGKKIQKISKQNEIIQSLSQRIHSLRVLGKFAMACFQDKTLSQSMLDCCWMVILETPQPPYAMPPKEAVKATLIQTTQFWIYREKILRDAGHLSSMGVNLSEILKLLQKTLGPQGEINRKALHRLEEDLIGKVISVTGRFYEIFGELVAAKRNELTHEQWCRNVGSPLASAKSQDDFIEFLQAIKIHTIITKTVLEEIFDNFETHLVDCPDRFQVNPSANRFINLISEGRTLLDHDDLAITTLPIPEALAAFPLADWQAQSIEFHQAFFKLLRMWTVTKQYSMSFIPELCAMAETMPTFEGIKWLRMRLALTIFKNKLDLWMKKWDELTHRFESETIKLLKTIPEEQRQETAEQIGQWMLMQKKEHKAIIDLLCLGTWIDSLALDVYKESTRDLEEDFSCFFPHHLKNVLNSFEPERLYEAATPRPTLTMQPVALPPLQPNAPQQQPQALPAPRTKPKIKRRGQAAPVQEAQEPQPQPLPVEEKQTVEWKAGEKTRNLLQDLYGLGFARVSQQGSHMKLVLNDRIVIVPDHPEQRQGTLISIARQAGVTIVHPKS